MSYKEGLKTKPLNNKITQNNHLFQNKNKNDVFNRIRLNANLVKDYFSYRNINSKFLSETLLYTIYKSHLKFAE